MIYIYFSSKTSTSPMANSSQSCSQNFDEYTIFVNYFQITCTFEPTIFSMKFVASH